MRVKGNELAFYFYVHAVLHKFQHSLISQEISMKAHQCEMSTVRDQGTIPTMQSVILPFVWIRILHCPGNICREPSQELGC